ncbi:MAG: TRAP transporter small permease, partial [Betaproteobacteria bacterium]
MWFLRALDRRLAKLEDLLIMAMVAMIAIFLGLGVVLRYVFNNPLTWAEEFVVTLFVWSVMLGVP